MSSKNNVNPGQYKTRGSLRQGEDVIHDVQKKAFTQSPDQNQDEAQNLIPEAQPEGSVHNKEKPEREGAKKSHPGR